MVLTIGGVSLTHEIAGEIELGYDEARTLSSPLPLWERVDAMRKHRDG